MGHIFGINWQRYHADGGDLAHIERMGYRSVLLYEWMWSDRDFCANLLAVLPQDCIIILRDHPLSEQKSDMYIEPRGTGQRHATEWRAKFRDGRVFIPRDRCWVQGINEPDSNHAQAAIDAYTVELARGLDAEGIRCAGWVFGTGHPSTVDLQPTAPVDWHWYAASAQALQEYGGLADFHGYGSWNNMALDNHLCRAETCPYALPAVYSEFGIDEGIVGNHGQGWKAHLSADQYVAWLDAAQLRVRERLAKSNLDLKALCLFTYDTNSDWKSFDVQEIRGKLETGWSTPAFTPPDGQHTTHLPQVGSGPQTPTAEPPQPQPEAEQYPPGVIDPFALEAIMQVESGGRSFAGGRMVIRFEAHIFERELDDPGLFAAHFRYDSGVPWREQFWRRWQGEPWTGIHTGSQDSEWAVFEFARQLDEAAAMRSISMGAPQIMGFNHARIGYPSPQAMFAAFGGSAFHQWAGLVNFILSSPELADALRRRDWREVARLYNGPGQVDAVSAQLADAYALMRGETKTA